MLLYSFQQLNQFYWQYCSFEQASATANKYIYSLGNAGDNTWDGTAITGEIQTGDLMLENTPGLILRFVIS